jgi:hypothetical protein
MEFVEEQFVPSKVVNTKLGLEELVIVPIGDVHWEAAAASKKGFKQFLKDVESEFTNPYYIGMGDYLDACRTTVRKTYKQLSVDDGAPLDEFIETRRKAFSGLLKHTKGRWLGMLAGNHSWDFRDGTTTETRLCADLDAPFLGDCADIKMTFKDEEGKTRGDIGIWCHHGTGCNRKYPVGHLLDKVCPHFPDSDIFLMGHSHVREYRDFPRLHRAGQGYIERAGVAAITGGWLGAYKQGPSTYVERRALQPLALGSLVIKVRPRVVRGYFAPKIRVESI